MTVYPRICSSLKQRHKYEDGTRPPPQPTYTWRTNGEEDLCDISDHHQTGTEETSFSEQAYFRTNKMIMWQHINEINFFKTFYFFAQCKGN